MDQLHGKEPVQAVGEQLVESDQIRVGDIGKSPELPLEAVQVRPLRMTQELQSDADRAFAIEGFVHDPEATLPQLANQLEPVGAGERMGQRGLQNAAKL